MVQSPVRAGAKPADAHGSAFFASSPFWLFACSVHRRSELDPKDAGFSLQKKEQGRVETESSPLALLPDLRGLPLWVAGRSARMARWDSFSGY